MYIEQKVITKRESLFNFIFSIFYKKTFFYQKKKFENKKLSDDILDAVSSENSMANTQTKQKDASNKIKKKFENTARKEANLNETTFSDFIPLKTYS